MDFTAATVEFLKFLNNITGSYGLAIIALTIIVRAILWPLGVSQQRIAVHLYNTVTTAEVDLTKGSLQRYAYGEKETITMKQLSNDTFAAVVVPQNIERRTPLVEVTMDGIAYLLSYSTSFRPGYQHTITVTLNTSPEQEKIEINIDGEVGEWE